ncbi:(E2-independent) E3 ubiquitin-conjugating enzyme FATS [Mixophyes fleayi]|uniref:(E2-independent) E3 ubiquitin-conjugating enzyme FATS n=1 Tax=Mixophyes fleayi TaxID=3061075 RepID=UPI003F4DF9E1
MIDESESEDDRKLHPSLSLITESNASSKKQSLVNHHPVSINRTFTPLPIKLEIQTALDRTVRRANLHPAREKHSLDMKKGFSSITITARRYIASLSNAPKEITSDPASSLSRSNDLLMKAPVSSDEHDQQCRYLDNGEYPSQGFKPLGFLRSQELPRQNDMISNVETNGVYLKESRNDKNHSLFMSVVHIKRNQTCPGTINYIDRSFYLPLGQCPTANQRIYKSTRSFKIKCPPVRPDDTCSRRTMISPTLVFCRHHTEENKQFRPAEYQTPNPLCQLQIAQRKAKQGIPVEQHNRCQLNPCHDVSNCLKVKAFGLPNMPEKDSLPVCEIYAEKDSSLEGSIHLGPERSNTTTFNFIFGKQISNQQKNQQHLQKENISPKCYMWHKSRSYDKENMSLPKLTENNKSREFSQEIMSLQEALEHRRPDFIFNSQERVHKLELKVHRRKIQKQDIPKTTKLAPRSTNPRQKIFTVPHPLSDNLFNPKERAISEREMQRRSKRIYNSLPEVKKKKEDEEKRIITQSNRLRAQLFKKKLLNQILQRSLD